MKDILDPKCLPFLPDVEPQGQLTHASVKYSCEIPKGKAIFFPLSQSSCWLGNPEFKKYSNKLAPNPQADQELKTCAVSKTLYSKNKKIGLKFKSFRDDRNNADYCLALSSFNRANSEVIVKEIEKMIQQVKVL